jgi:predicted membrane channel-forming protein YqfA (hemolysin III family)
MKLSSLDQLPTGWCAYAYTRTGYRVNLSFSEATRSVFYWNHNEFWMIWTDVIPLCVFVTLLARARPSSLALGVHLGVIISRLFSCIYHIYNCCSLRASQRLINLDLIGIACMALGSPWLYSLANRAHEDVGFMAYTGVLAIFYACCVGLFAHCLFSNGVQRTEWRQPLLIVLAIIGNYPVIQMDASHTAYLARSAVILFLCGYVVFFTLKFPERCFTHISFDGSLLNSHVLWHMTASGAQLCFVALTFVSD